MATDASNSSVHGEVRARAASVDFYFAAQLVLLLAVFIGFSQSLYLRPLFTGRPLPPVLYVHGTVLTLWFCLTVLQGWLVRTHRYRVHRRMGFVIAGYATVVVVMGVIADLMLARQIEVPKDPENIVVWGNLFSLALFAAFVTLAVLLRRYSEAHKRLTLLASISIVGPALARFSNWSIFPGGMEARPMYGIGGLLLLFLALIVHDVIVRRRPHPVSWIGSLVFIASLGLAGFLAFSGRGYALLHGT